MLRLLTRGVFALAATTLCFFAFGSPAAAPDIGLQTVNLSCNDGTNLTTALSATQLTALTNAVNAIALYPAGSPALSCGLSQPATPTTNNGNGNPHDFATGGGQFIYPPGGADCTVNFSLTAHAPDTDTGPQPATGTMNESMPGNSNCLFGQSDLVTKVDCLQVNGNTARFTSTVQKATGFWAGNAVGSELTWTVTDNTPDTIAGNGGATAPCDFTPAQTQFPIEHGNINVHDNE